MSQAEIPFDPNKFTAHVVSEAVKSVGKNFIQHATTKGRAYLDKLAAEYQLGFGEFLETSYLRCKQVKTLLSRDRPTALLSLYVNLSLTCGNKITDDELISNLKEYRHVVVTGLAGTGKSMFMKYLTVCRFERQLEAIPLFVELRNLNTQKAKPLLEYIYSFCSTAKKTVTFNRFEEGLKAGAFLIILDGFDELDYECRDEVAKQIRRISDEYPETIIVISSRPDDRFKSWQSFYVFEVQRLSIEQVIQLIDKIEYEEGVKERFIKQIKLKLYSTHKSFLEIPLLATMMLLTFERFAEISPKIHLFYKQAFETLFREHDAQKEQFKRKLKTNLAFDDFENFFAAFCVSTYLDQKFSFNEKDLKSYVSRAIQHKNLAVSSDDLISDLKDCVCLLQQDGLEITFVHRSFQEYFAAVFASRHHGDNTKQLFDGISKRANDNTLPMLLEIARDKTEAIWVLPTIKNALSLLSAAKKKKSVVEQLKVMCVKFEASFSKDSGKYGSYGITGPKVNNVMSNMSALWKLYKFTDVDPSNNILMRLDPDLIQPALKKLGFEKEPRYAKIYSNKDYVLIFDSVDEVLLKELKVDQVLTAWDKALRELKSSIEQRLKNSEKLLSAQFI